MTRNFYKNYLAVILIVAGVVFFNNYLTDNFLQNFVYKITEKPGIFLTDNLLNFSRYSSGYLKTKMIIDDNARFYKENNILRGQLAELESLKRENNFLREELGVAKRLDSPLLLARIFNIQRSALSSTALINKGVKNGIEKKMPVIATGNILVGITEQVFDDSALILLIDDPRIKISGLVQHQFEPSQTDAGQVQESRTLVETKGELQNNLVLNLVANSDEIREGETIVTSGLDGLPEALLVAKIIKVESSSSTLFKNVSAKPIFDPSLGSSLFVILK
ncbi:MAG: rod shape-determining protein MreC [Candidatus Yanofskybacteria bacterium]|nr:rod shape-determining protein MreC [Candidatus Yanofskybacteria bacterium]